MAPLDKVCLSVTRSVTLILALQGTRRHISDTSGFRTTRACKPFHETTAFERYAVKTSNCIIALGFPRPDPRSLCTLGAQEVTTNGMYRLSHTVASPCQTLRELLAGYRGYIQIAQPIKQYRAREVRRGFALQCYKSDNTPKPPHYSLLAKFYTTKKYATVVLACAGQCAVAQTFDCNSDAGKIGFLENGARTDPNCYNPVLRLLRDESLPSLAEIAVVSDKFFNVQSDSRRISLHHRYAKTIVQG